LYETTPKRKGIRIRIEANIAIDIYVVQASDLQSWRRSSRNYGRAAFLSRKLLDARIDIPKESEPDWYLILDNVGERPAAVHYEIFDILREGTSANGHASRNLPHVRSAQSRRLPRGRECR
jgi:hypothetical protein